MNKAILMGRLTRDPELKQTQSGVSVVKFTLAVERRFKNQNGEREADFISCVAWRQTAEFIAKYFNKGNKLGIVGSIQTGSYDKDGQTVYTTDVVADEAYFIESQGASAESQRSHSGASAESQRSSGGAGTNRDTSGYKPRQDTYTPDADDTMLPFDL